MSLNLDPAFKSFPTLRTNRLDLVALDDNDADRILHIRGNEKLMHFIPRPMTTTLDEAFAHISDNRGYFERKEGINWGLHFQEKKHLLGMAGLYRFQESNHRAELGYMLDSVYHRQGIVSEACQTIVEFAFRDMKLHSLEVVIDPENHASEGVLKKLGFVKEAHLRENFCWKGKFLDTVIYSLLNPYQ